MILISKQEANAIRKKYPAAEIAKTKYHRFLPEEKRYLLEISDLGNGEAKSALEERYGCTWNENTRSAL